MFLFYVTVRMLINIVKSILNMHKNYKEEKNIHKRIQKRTKEGENVENEIKKRSQQIPSKNERQQTESH